MEEMFSHLPVLFVECVNADEEVLEAILEKKAFLKEFAHLSPQEALDGFTKRIGFYESTYEPLQDERNRILIDSFEACILQENISDLIPYFDRIKDIITTRIVRNLFLLRHGQTFYNIEDRIGGGFRPDRKGPATSRISGPLFFCLADSGHLHQ